MISEFELWLRSRTSKEKPFHEETILANAKAARALDAWMTRKKIDRGFTACDTAVLNGFFRDYNAARSAASWPGAIWTTGRSCVPCTAWPSRCGS